MSATLETQMDRDQLMRRFAEAVAADAGLLKDGWHRLVLVAVVKPAAIDLMGFCYTQDGRTLPVSPKNFALFDVLRELRAAMAEADSKAPWLGALFRIERATGKLTADFEYDHPERWAITPANAKARAQEFAAG